MWLKCHKKTERTGTLPYMNCLSWKNLDGQSDNELNKTIVSNFIACQEWHHEWHVRIINLKKLIRFSKVQLTMLSHTFVSFCCTNTILEKQQTLSNPSFVLYFHPGTTNSITCFMSLNMRSNSKKTIYDQRNKIYIDIAMPAFDRNYMIEISFDGNFVKKTQRNCRS